MKPSRYVLFALTLLIGVSIPLPSVESAGQQLPQQPTILNAVPGPVTDEQAQEGFLRILINDQNGEDKDWKMRSSYLRWVGFTDDEIEHVKPLIENFKINIEEMDNQSLALSAQNFAAPSDTTRTHIDAIAREKKSYIASTYLGIAQLTDSFRLKGHLDLRLKPTIKHFTTNAEDKKIGWFFENPIRRYFTVSAQPPSNPPPVPCSASGSVSSQTWIDYVGLMAYTTGSIISYTNSCGHSGWTETTIRLNGVPYQVPPTWYFPLDPGGTAPLLSGNFRGTNIGYTYCTMANHQMGWAGAGSEANVSGLVAVTKLTPGNGSVMPGSSVAFVADVKSTGEIGSGNIGVRVLIDSNPNGLTFNPTFPKTKEQTAAGFLTVQFGASSHTNSNVHGPVVFTCGITQVPANAIAGGSPQSSTICFGSTQGGTPCQ